MNTIGASVEFLIIRALQLSETLSREFFVHSSHRSVVHLDLWFDVGLLPRNESGGRVDPLTRSLARGGQDHDAVEQNGGGTVPVHLVEPNKVHARRRTRSSGDRHVVAFRICLFVLQKFVTRSFKTE